MIAVTVKDRMYKVQNFDYVKGRKYYKVICDYLGAKSGYMFVNKKTGDLYRPASYNYCNS